MKRKSRCRPRRVVTLFCLFVNALCRLLVPESSVNAADSAHTTLRCRAVDADSGAILPCRAYLQSDRGDWFYATPVDPAGTAIRYDVARSPRSFERHTTVSAHPFAFQTPAGDYTLTVERGKEYRPYSAKISVGDRPVEHEVRLQRWINLAERGWFSGDTHLHRSLDDLPNIMLAEDLNVAMPLSFWVHAAHVPPARHDKSVSVTGRLVEVDATHVIWPMNTEYELFSVGDRKKHTLGAVFVLNHREPLGSAAPPVRPVAREARQQGAILDFDKHNWPWSMMIVPEMGVDLFELCNNHLWRTEFSFKNWYFEHRPQGWNIEADADGFTEAGWRDFGFRTYYAFLNSGFRMRPSAGTASGVHPVPAGFGRVYVHLPQGFSYDKWVAGLNAGTSFVTTGPMLFATVNGDLPGATQRFDRPVPVRVQGLAESGQTLDRVEIIKNGEVVDTFRPADGAKASCIAFDKAYMPDGTAWFAVRAFEKDETAPGRLRFAHTAPVFCDVASRPLRAHQGEVDFFIACIERELERNRGVLTSEELAEYERARDVYRKLLGQ